MFPPYFWSLNIFLNTLGYIVPSGVWTHFIYSIVLSRLSDLNVKLKYKAKRNMTMSLSQDYILLKLRLYILYILQFRIIFNVSAPHQRKNQNEGGLNIMSLCHKYQKCTGTPFPPKQFNAWIRASVGSQTSSSHIDKESAFSWENWIKSSMNKTNAGLEPRATGLLWSTRLTKTFKLRHF